MIQEIGSIPMLSFDGKITQSELQNTAMHAEQFRKINTFIISNDYTSEEVTLKCFE